MEAVAQAEWMIEKHGENALQEHDKIMKDICLIYGGDEQRAINDSQSYPHLIEVRDLIGCQCEAPEIHTNVDGINFCKKCKIEVALLSPPKK